MNDYRKKNHSYIKKEIEIIELLDLSEISCGAQVVGLTRYNGCKLKQLSDHSLYVAVEDMQIVEAIHMMLVYLMMWILCKMEALQ